MSQVKRDADEYAEKIAKVRVLVEMIVLVDRYPDASITELHEKAKHVLALYNEVLEQHEELQRKMEKDD